MTRLQIGWTSDRMTQHLIQRALRGKPELSLDAFETHETLLAADEAARYDVVVLRAKDPLNAERVREELRRRGPRTAIALCSGCDCVGGIRKAHDVDPDSFDRFFWKSGSLSHVVAWLESLALEDPAEASAAAARSRSSVPDTYLDLPDGERLWSEDLHGVSVERRAEQKAVLLEWRDLSEQLLSLFMKSLGAHHKAAKTSGEPLGRVDLPDAFASEFDALLDRLSAVNARVATNYLRLWTDEAVEASRSCIEATDLDELHEMWAVFWTRWSRAFDNGRNALLGVGARETRATLEGDPARVRYRWS